MAYSERNALCQLPHQQWPVLVEVVRETSSHIARIRLKKDTIETLNIWLIKQCKMNIPTGEREIFVPSNWLVPNITMMGRENEGHAGSHNGFPTEFKLDGLTYKLERFGNIECGDYVWFVVEGQPISIRTAKVVFTGTLKHCGYIHHAFIVTGKVDEQGNEEILKLNAENLYSLMDVIKIQNATRNINVKAEYQGGSVFLGAVDVPPANAMDASEERVVSGGEGGVAALARIEVVGSCVAKTYGYQNVEVEGLNHDFNIIFKLHDNTILGWVKNVCVLFGVVGEIEGTLFVGIQFEAPVTEPNSPVTVRHVEQFCKHDGKCKKGQAISIPLRLILEGDPSGVFSTLGLKKETLGILEGIYKNGFTSQLLPNPLEIEPLKSQMSVMGMEWENNSCYLDSVIFGMFAFTSKFDYCLEAFDKHQEDHGEVLSDSQLVANKKICNLLRCRIVAPLRRGFCVPSDPIKKLREILAEHYNPLFKSSYMDAEDFCLTMFGKVLRAPGFLHYDSGAEDHIYQIFAYPSQEKDPKIPSLQALIEQSFTESSVKLIKTPEPAFIVKLPFESNDATSHSFSLGAIICLENHHFTCFTKMGKGENPEWVYHNSVASPRCVLLEDLGIGLECVSRNDFSECSKSALTWILKIMKTAYLCVYEKVDL